MISVAAAFAASLLASSPSAFNRSNASFSLNSCFAIFSAVSIAKSFGVFGDGAATALVISVDILNFVGFLTTGVWGGLSSTANRVIYSGGFVCSTSIGSGSLM